jgi:hypothetical protein
MLNLNLNIKKMDITINTPEQLINFVNRNDISTENAVEVCKAFFNDAGNIPFSKQTTTKESILRAIDRRLNDGPKSVPMVFCDTIG